MSNDKFLKSLLILLIIFNSLFLIVWIVDKVVTPSHQTGRYHIIQDKTYEEGFILYDTVTGDMWYSNTIRSIIAEDRPDYIIGPINLKTGTSGETYKLQVNNPAKVEDE